MKHTHGGDDNHHFLNEQDDQNDDEARHYYESVRDRAVYTIPGNLMSFFARELNDITLREEQRVAKKLKTIEHEQRVIKIMTSRSSSRPHPRPKKRSRKEGIPFMLFSHSKIENQLMIEQCIYDNPPMVNTSLKPMVAQRIEFRHDQKYQLASSFNKRHIFYCIAEIFNLVVTHATYKSCAFMKLTCKMMYNYNLLSFTRNCNRYIEQMRKL